MHQCKLVMDSKIPRAVDFLPLRKSLHTPVNYCTTTADILLLIYSLIQIPNLNYPHV